MFQSLESKNKNEAYEYKILYSFDKIKVLLRSVVEFL